MGKSLVAGVVCVLPPLLYTVGAEDEAKQVHASSCAGMLSLSLGTTVERERVERGAARRYAARISLSSFPISLHLASPRRSEKMTVY